MPKVLTIISTYLGKHFLGIVRKFTFVLPTIHRVEILLHEPCVVLPKFLHFHGCDLLRGRDGISQLLGLFFKLGHQLLQPHFSHLGD